MPTKNRRVAAYLPPEIDERFRTFANERNLNGDSPALIAILSEYFGVSQQVAHQSSSEIAILQSRIESLEEKLTHIKSSLLSELRYELLEHRDNSIERTKAEVKDELLSELRGELPINNEVPGQLELIPDEQVSQEDRNDVSELPGELEGELPDVWMNTKQCWEYLGKPGLYSTFRNLKPEKLRQLYGVEADPSRKKRGKYGSSWLRMAT